MTPAELREEVRQLRERLDRMEEMQQRLRYEAWRQHQRERAEAIKRAEWRDAAEVAGLREQIK